MTIPGSRISMRQPPARRHRPTKMGWLLRDPRAMTGILFILLLAVIGVGAGWFAPHEPNELDLGATLALPTPEHWLGTDDLGRDTLSRIMYGAAPSLFSSIAAVALGLALGVPFGLMDGYIGGWVGTVISRVIDALLSFPTIILAVGIAAVLGPSLTNSIVAIGIAFSPQFARLMRATTLSVKQELYVDAARAISAGPVRILVRHILPNAVTPVVVHAALLLGTALLAESSLSFLGLGVQPPLVSWGGMIARSLNYLQVAPGQMLSPGIALVLTALAFNSLGETLRRWLDPKGPKA